MHTLTGLESGHAAPSGSGRRYLVTGGAGYVGSHVVKALHDRGDAVVVIDDLSQGHAASLPQAAELVVGNVADPALLHGVLSKGRWDGVLHFAALSLVGESMADPFRYLVANGCGGIGLIHACVQHGIRRFVLSSTANIYGPAGDGLIGEETPPAPSSPYGESKRIIERALHWAAIAHGLDSVALRYFNACGAEPDGSLGEDHDPETHLIPLAIDVTLGLRPELVVFGTDHATSDGTCIRDYVHVSDLARAHLDAISDQNPGAHIYNVGTSRGHSVLEVIRSVERVSGRKMKLRTGPRRAGDPAALVASNARIRKAFGWSPSFVKLDEAVETALNWRRAHPQGFADRPRAATPAHAGGSFHTPSIAAGPCLD